MLVFHTLCCLHMYVYMCLPIFFSSSQILSLSWMSCTVGRVLTIQPLTNWPSCLLIFCPLSLPWNACACSSKCRHCSFTQCLYCSMLTDASLRSVELLYGLSTWGLLKVLGPAACCCLISWIRFHTVSLRIVDSEWDLHTQWWKQSMHFSFRNGWCRYSQYALVSWWSVFAAGL